MTDATDNTSPERAATQEAQNNTTASQDEIESPQRDDNTSRRCGTTTQPRQETSNEIVQPLMQLCLQNIQQRLTEFNSTVHQNDNPPIDLSELPEELCAQLLANLLSQSLLTPQLVKQFSACGHPAIRQWLEKTCDVSRVWRIDNQQCRP